MKRIFWLALALAVTMLPLTGCNKHDVKDDCADYCAKLVGCNFEWWELSAADCTELCKQDVDDSVISQKNIDCALSSSCSELENDACAE